MNSSGSHQEGDERQQQRPALVQISSRRDLIESQKPRIDAYHNLRDRLSASTGRAYWRSLDELSNTPEFRRQIENEFPEQAAEFNDPVSRRRFLELMGASLALAGLGTTACSYQPEERLVPYVQQPEPIVPGKALFFATALPHGAIGLLGRSNWGRPTKAEGNPDHPASLGHTDLFAQASILDLYDPDRSKVVMERGAPGSWARLVGELRARLEPERGGGASLRILTGTVHSPTLARQMRALLAEFPQARWVQYEPCGRDYVREGARQAFGEPVNTIYRFDLAARVLSIDSDFLSGQGGANLRYARDYITARTPAGDRPDIGNKLGGELARLYAIEVEPKQTGAKADHRLALRPSDLGPLVRSLARAFDLAANITGTTGTSGATGASGTTGASSTSGASGASSAGATLAPERMKWIESMARDLLAHRGQSIVIVGDAMPPAVHALGHALNDALGNVGRTVFHTEPVEFNPTNQLAELQTLAGELNAGQVRTLLIAGTNPVYTAPADLNFASALERVEWRMHLGLHFDETAELCHWHVPESHFYEAWSDVRAFDGTTTIIQPLINPLYQSRSIHELIGALGSQPATDGYEIVRATYAATRTATGPVPAPSPAQARAGAQSGATADDDFELRWRRMLHSGVVPDTAFELRARPVAAGLAASLLALRDEEIMPRGADRPAADTLDIVFRPDPTIHDGRYANNGWLQECPKPLSTLTWSNAAILSPRTAARLGLKMEALFAGGGYEVDIVRLTLAGREVEAPVWVLPGQPDETVTVHLGYGRTRAGRVGNGAGFNACLLRTSQALWHGTGARLEPTGRRTEMAGTQTHFGMEGHDLVRVATIDEYRTEAEHAFQRPHDNAGREASLYPEYPYPFHRWGMVIDNNACIGCNACVIACQSENNVPVVGREQVLRSREMHWLRIDNYYHGEDAADAGGPYFEPLMCVHCEKAPCEPVCPVHATVHDAEGLNVMVYNRCIGTRYCSNNCPYKVRRFNFLLYNDWETEQLKMARNPEVTVRSRGVMEKCTYCTQRIQEAKVTASREGRKVRDGEVVTACQAVCPTEAIIFGDLNDEQSLLARIRATTRRDYPLLGELGTQPRTHHLGALRNPNPELEPQPAEKQATR